MSATREDVVREALSWEGTPFHDAAGVKGAGTDCLHFIVRVFVAVGLLEDFNPAPYAPQWFLHREEPLFLQGLERHAHRVDAGLPGDILMFNFGRHAAHAAILLDGDQIIHAYKPVGCVTRDSRAAHAHRYHSTWSLF
jgi:NlpC/P60 family putative phage cell wall peptidase